MHLPLISFRLFLNRAIRLCFVTVFGLNLTAAAAASPLSFIVPHPLDIRIYNHPFPSPVFGVDDYTVRFKRGKCRGMIGAGHQCIQDNSTIININNNVYLFVYLCFVIQETVSANFVLILNNFRSKNYSDLTKSF